MTALSRLFLLFIIIVLHVVESSANNKLCPVSFLLIPSNSNVLESRDGLLTGFITTLVNKKAFRVAVFYFIYSYVVQKYADIVVKRMQEVPSPEKLLERNSNGGKFGTLSTPSELRETVSNRSNLVIKPQDRLKWNEWIASGEKVKGSDIVSLIGIMHHFQYRSYANFEEAGAFVKPFYTWKRFILTFQKPSTFVLSKAGKAGKDGTIALATLSDHFIIFGIIPLHISWSGKVIIHGRHCRINWISTKALIHLPGKIIVKENAEVSMKLASTPWDIQKMDDGMICFRRGSIGYLVFDRNK